VRGSIILAGVLLKIGGYGILRFLNLFKGFSLYSNIFLIIRLIGAIFIRLICLNIVDLKMLIAYSSVVHISLVIGGLLRNYLTGLIGSVYLILGHGLCSSSLFFLLNLNYSRSGRRSFILNKGSYLLIPLYGF